MTFSSVPRVWHVAWGSILFCRLATSRCFSWFPRLMMQPSWRPTASRDWSKVNLAIVSAKRGVYFYRGPSYDLRGKSHETETLTLCIGALEVWNCVINEIPTQPQDYTLLCLLQCHPDVFLGVVRSCIGNQRYASIHEFQAVQTSWQLRSETAWKPERTSDRLSKEGLGGERSDFISCHSLTHI